MNRKKSREAIANEEVGNTDIASASARFLAVFFLGIITCILLTQIFTINLPSFTIEENPKDSCITKIKKRNINLLQQINILETELEEESIIRRIFLSPVQRLMLAFGRGNEKVVAGKNGWLYYRLDVDALLGNSFLSSTHLARRQQAHALWEKPIQPNPLNAIIHFRDQLAAQGIELVIVIAPIKPPLAMAGYINEHTYAKNVFHNRGFQTFLHKLDEAHVNYLDPSSIISSVGYLYTDTHWRPETMEAVAKSLAKRIKPLLNEYRVFTRDINSVAINSIGDIQRMLLLDTKNKQSVTIHQILEDEKFWHPQQKSEVLLLGDSFTNIFSKENLGWGRSAGFAEQLSYFLEQPIDVISRNDSGAFITRQMLAAELTRGNNRLVGKKVVVWEFSARELFFGDWKMISLPLFEAITTKNIDQKEKPVEFLVIADKEKKIVEATVQAISSSPRPGTVPYRDNLITIHLVDIDKKDGTNSREALVYAFGMKDNTLTAINAVQTGERIKIELSSWDSVEPEYGAIRRSPLDDEMVELEIPNWGEFTTTTSENKGE